MGNACMDLAMIMSRCPGIHKLLEWMMTCYDPNRALEQIGLYDLGSAGHEKSCDHGAGCWEME